jgi:hypothetical protein
MNLNMIDPSCFRMLFFAVFPGRASLGAYSLGSVQADTACFEIVESLASLVEPSRIVDPLLSTTSEALRLGS